MFCGVCGRFEDDEGARYCRVCGKSLVEITSKSKQFFVLPKTDLPGTISGLRGQTAEREPKIFPSSKRPLSRNEREALNLFRHLKDQIDLTNSESELKSLLNESETHRRAHSQSADDYYSELLNEQHLSIVKKVRSRAAYVSFKQSAKFAAGVATRILFL